MAVAHVEARRQGDVEKAGAEPESTGVDILVKAKEVASSHAADLIYRHDHGKASQDALAHSANRALVV